MRKIMKGIKDIIVKGSIFVVLSAVFCMGGIPAAPLVSTAHAEVIWSEDMTFNESTTMSDGVRLSKDTTLTVAEGKTLTINGSINCNSNTLTIAGPGTVTVIGESDLPGIYQGEKVTLESGTLNVTGRNNGGIAASYVTITGGTLNVTVEYDTGIRVDENFTITGGTVTVTGGDNGDGISVGGKFTITGGTVTATGGNGGSGISVGRNLTLEGGTLTATGDEDVQKPFGEVSAIMIPNGIAYSDGTNIYSRDIYNSETMQALNGKTLTPCAAAIDRVYYITIQEALDAADGKTVKLLRDVKTDSYLDILGKTITLDLNGHTIDRGLETPTSNGYVIKVGNEGENKGNLTLTDSSEAKTGLITGGRINEGSGEGSGGGVYVGSNNAVFTMNGGTISGNTARYTGGGVYVGHNSAFIMNGGTICNNKADSFGGGVYVVRAGTLTMTGGIIKDNKVNQKVQNVYLNTGQTITISGELDETTSIGIMTAKKPTDANPISITSGWNSYMEGIDPSPYFIYDDPDYAPALSGTGEVEFRICYAVTVNNGSVSRSYVEGATVTVKADAPPAGKVFDKWTTEDGVEFANAASETTTFTMPANAVTVEATYKDMEKVKAPAFTPDGGTYTSAQSVTISSETSDADIYYTIDGSTPTKDSGKKYSELVSVTKTMTIKAIAIKADMADSDVSSATYTINSAPPAKTYAVTVENGDGDGNYAAGATVTIKADAPSEGQVFDRWTTGDGVTFANASSETTTFTMPAKAVTVKATYRDKNTVAVPIFSPDGGNYTDEQSVTISCSTEGAVIYYTVDGTVPTKASAKYSEPIPVKEDMTIKAFAVKDGMTDSAVSVAAYTIGSETPVITKYLVTVNNGTGDGEYAENETVTIKADEPAEGKSFDKWTTEDGVEFADAASPETTFRMPSHDVTVTATYKDKEQKKEDDPDPKNPDSGNPGADKTKVPVTDPSSSYASPEDNFAPVAPGASEGTGGNIKKLELDFSNVKGSGVATDSLKMTAIAGSKFTTKEKVKDKNSVTTEGGVKAKFNKKDSTVTIACKSTGKATFNMEDGDSYTVNFTVDKPKPNKNEAKLSTGTAPVTKTVKDLFGTSINGGKLTILKEKVSGQAAVKDNELTVNPAEKDTIKLQYQYLNKKYKLNIKVK